MTEPICTKLKCPKCQSTEFSHKHKAPYGLMGAHFAGSERFECKQCGNSLFKEEGEKYGFHFVLD